MQLPKVIKTKGIRVLTTKQIAEAYETTTDIIGYNFRYNKKRYVEGKHYIMLEGKELREFKSTNVEIQRSLPKINKLYLWTEKGALLHAKSLNTDKAWQVYEYLVDFYFRVQEEKPKQKELKPNTKTVVNIPENPQMLEAIKKLRNDLVCMDTLLENCIRFSDEKTFEDRRKTALDTIQIIMHDSIQFEQLRPQLVQKFY